MLSFSALRTVNVLRCLTHFHPIEDWSPTDWATALAGECGEACNVIKKIRRLQTAPHWSPEDGNRDLIAEVADELADVIIYTDLLAVRLGIDLEQAVRTKFNKTSDKIGSLIRL